MPIDVRCPACGAKYRVSESAAGRSLRCKSAGCGEEISVPEIDDVPEIVTDEDDFASNLGEAAADLGEPVPPPVPAPALRRKRRCVAKRGRRPLAGRSHCSDLAHVSRVLGISSILLSYLTGLPAVVLGIIASSGFAAATADFRAAGWRSPASVSAPSPRR